MKTKDIQTDKVYRAKVSGRVVKVKVLAIRTATKYKRDSFNNLVAVPYTVFDVENLATGREIIFYSARRFR